ncbi:MAG: TatD family hydrolase [Candidatus Eremiobacteraeota bacterium]|nr:TatD family hydrolase [Candidatus Eremiobacteraeota bacterium]MBC5827802.1 TatD family hydrolase [Candidatus Eremiobacteraeota bacterium]
MLVDTHAHLDGGEYATDLAAVLDRARTAGVALTVTAGQDRATSAASIGLTRRFAGVAAAVGVHPHEAASAGDLQWLDALGQDAAVVAAGEMGLDYHYDFSPRTVQREVFARQLDFARRQRLPAVIHCREAHADAAAILRRHLAAAGGAVMHCFTGTYDLGKTLIGDFDVYLGIGGAVTFKNAHDLHDAVARLPLERLLLETDCPYMTPAPHRGKRNEPAHVALVCERIAQLRKQPVSRIAQATSANALRLFPRLSPFLAAAGGGTDAVSSVGSVE